MRLPASRVKGGELRTSIAAVQNYYLILSAQTHGKNVPYDMVIRRIRAFVPSTSAVAPTPKWKPAKPAVCANMIS